MDVQPNVDIRLARVLMDASIICPAATCGYHAKCVAYVPGELAAFVCCACQTKYWVGLGPNPVLRVESTAPTEVAS